jgi:hypothetical protein
MRLSGPATALPRFLILAVPLAAAARAGADVIILGATRTVHAEGNYPGAPHELTEHSTAVVGAWSDFVSAPMALARQRSTLSPDVVAFEGEAGAGLNGDSFGLGFSRLTALLDVTDATRWDLVSTWTWRPPTNHHLVRASDGVDLFAGVDWSSRTTTATGWLTAGVYELRLDITVMNAGFNASNDLTLTFGPVPAPATLAVPAAALLAARRRRPR